MLTPVVARLNDAAQASPAVYAAAVAEFERLYSELLTAVAPLGVRVAAHDGRMSARPEPGTVVVPPAGELRAELEREGR